MSLSQVTAQLCRMLGLKVQLLPMSNEPVRTKIISGRLRLDFQEYFVKRGTRDEVNDVLFEGAEKARPAPGILEAIRGAERIIICPSNPILSISPILSIKQILTELRRTKAPIVGVSPIIGGKTVKGPADRIMASMGLEASAYGVAKFYRDKGVLSHFIIDEIDRQHKKRIEKLGVRVAVANTIMRSLEDSIRLAKLAMEVS